MSAIKQRVLKPLGLACGPGQNGRKLMIRAVGTLDELPVDYRERMEKSNVAPLWPFLRNLVPENEPKPLTKTCLWSYRDIRPLALRAGELTPVEKAERRVLVLCDPGQGESARQATSTIYLGIQLLLPGEHAPSHRHTPSAARIIVEGEGAYTIVNGEKCVMHQGDLVLTPGGTWHEHGHEGTDPVLWLDVLDLPILINLEASYGEEGQTQSAQQRPDTSQVEYSQAGLVPHRSYGSERAVYPLLRYPWQRTEAALRTMAQHVGSDQPIEVEYVNPESGDPCLRTLGFTAMMLSPDRVDSPPIRSSSSAFHVIAGSGQSIINGKTLRWERGDTFSAPVFAKMEHRALGEEPSFLIRIHDGPLRQKLGLYEERSHG